MLINIDKIHTTVIYIHPFYLQLKMTQKFTMGSFGYENDSLKAWICCLLDAISPLLICEKCPLYTPCKVQMQEIIPSQMCRPLGEYWYWSRHPSIGK